VAVVVAESCAWRGLPSPVDPRGFAKLGVGPVDFVRTFVLAFFLVVVVALGAMPFEEHAADRASAFELEPGVTVTTCSAEDLIVHKAFAARDKDWLDTEGIVTRCGAGLDRALVWSELSPLLGSKMTRLSNRGCGGCSNGSDGEIQ
jgi:hypothetical protein